MFNRTQRLDGVPRLALHRQLSQPNRPNPQERHGQFLCFLNHFEEVFANFIL